jgi:hypothetical protein
MMLTALRILNRDRSKERARAGERHSYLSGQGLILIFMTLGLLFSPLPSHAHGPDPVPAVAHLKVEKIADIPLPVALAIPPDGSPFGNYLYVASFF